MRLRLLVLALAILPLARSAYSKGCLAEVAHNDLVTGKLDTADQKEFDLYKCELTGVVLEVASLRDGEIVTVVHKCQGAEAQRIFTYDACNVHKAIIVPIHVGTQASPSV